MALIRASAPLTRELARLFPSRPFHSRFWDGGSVAATEPGSPTFFVRRPSALAHFLRAPSSLGLGRAYVEGSLAVDDLDLAFVVVDEWQPPELSRADRLRLGLALAAAAAPGGWPRRPGLELILRGGLHSVERDAAAVRYHYDVGNEFFELFLDESMTYSCAIFSRGARTLEEAQLTKLELVARKLELEPGMRVLDVGCGWGSFAIHAARDHGVSVTGVTLSPPQAELARRRAAEAGVAERVEILVADYRRLPRSSFDAIASIGMAEHVGEGQIDLYARSLFALLRPGGRLLNHAIAALDPDHKPLDDIFSTRYVFPDGEPLPVSRVLLALERAGFETKHVEGFRDDYAVTLRRWSERLDRQLPRAEALAGAERTRIWRLYLRAARRGFETSHTAVYQVGARREGAPTQEQEREQASAARDGRLPAEDGYQPSWGAADQAPAGGVQSRLARQGSSRSRAAGVRR
ncbi:MAG TPA: cyclopropane-fatty-acyl-phospholipid synthase family protein [Solirubrobacteraceae bacterium]|nr:cyclopropane-fatty-acyl-phospholipid synthase family protein [Solirubrobacteraceae bacterium]